MLLSLYKGLLDTSLAALQCVGVFFQSFCVSHWLYTGALACYLQVFCSKVSPNCGACPLQASCEYALNNGKRLQPQAMKPSSVQHQVSCTLSTSNALFSTDSNALFSIDSNALNRP